LGTPLTFIEDYLLTKFRLKKVTFGNLMIIGSVILAVDPNFFRWFGFTTVGTGFFNPNISSMVGTVI
jgi:POT family proton-dependent oligopeptide transporter